MNELNKRDRRVMEVSAGSVTATAAKAGIVVAVLFLIFGVVFFVVVFNDTPASETGEQLLMNGFALIWVVVCVSIIVLNARLLRRRTNSSPSSLLHIEETTVLANETPAAGGDFAARLRGLEGLRRDGLLNEEEYRRKRAEIMNETW